jgi:transposase-like protein
LRKKALRALHFALESTSAVQGRKKAQNGECKWLFRAIDKQGRTVDFLLTHRRMWIGVQF